jgi:hypothetical protein
VQGAFLFFDVKLSAVSKSLHKKGPSPINNITSIHFIVGLTSVVLYAMSGTPKKTQFNAVS